MQIADIERALANLTFVCERDPDDSETVLFNHMSPNEAPDRDDCATIHVEDDRIVYEDDVETIACESPEAFQSFIERLMTEGWDNVSLPPGVNTMW